MRSVGGHQVVVDVSTVDFHAESGAGGETHRLTFTTINQGSVALFEVKELAGSNTDTFWRAIATFSGGSRVFDFLVTLGIRKTGG